MPAMQSPVLAPSSATISPRFPHTDRTWTPPTPPLKLWDSSIGGLTAADFGAVAQLGERCVRNAEVEGSTPFRSILFKSFQGNDLCEFARSATMIFRTIGDTFGDTFSTVSGTTVPSFSAGRRRRPA
jgi:hypothetical protein